MFLFLTYNILHKYCTAQASSCAKNQYVFVFVIYSLSFLRLSQILRTRYFHMLFVYHIPTEIKISVVLWEVMRM